MKYICLILGNFDSCAGKCCTGKAQSPIDLNSKIAVAPSPDPGPIQFHHYQQQAQGVLKNNGHTVEFSFQNKTFNPTISRGKIVQTLNFKQKQGLKYLNGRFFL